MEFILALLSPIAHGQTTTVSSVSTTTSMVQPTNTPTPQPPTTEAPTQAPFPTDDNFKLNDSDGKICLHMKAGLGIDVTYVFKNTDLKVSGVVYHICYSSYLLFPVSTEPHQF